MRLIPPNEGVGTRSHAERKVAELLREIGDDDGVAFHSVPLPRHHRKVMGEVDFVVLWKGAILVLEVKGGQIGQSGDGVWYSTDRGGHRHPLRRNPWDQAGDAAYTLLDILASLSDDDGWPFAFAVVTPDQSLAADTEWAPRQHIGLEQMTTAWLERGLDALARLAGPRPPDTDRSRRPDVRPMENLPPIFAQLRHEVDAMRRAPDTASGTASGPTTRR